MPPGITAVDLFCGVGGLTHGLHRAGVDVRAGFDVDAGCRYPYEKNNPASFVEADVAALRGEELAPHLSGGEVTLLAGCAPCQPFSTYSRSGRGRHHDQEWPLLLSFGRLVDELQPDLVTMENVPQVLDHDVFTGFIESLADYHTWWGVVECAELGIPQTRKRLVLLASRLTKSGLELLEPSQHRQSVRDAIGALPPIDAGGRLASDPLHTSSRLSPLNTKRIRASRPGGTWRDWPEELRAACHTRQSGATYPSVYGRMSWDGPAPTITTQCFGYGNGRFGHPVQDRAISLREAAMLQTFPRDYAFVPHGETIRFNRMGRLIGNAVPVRLGEIIGESLQRHVAIWDEERAVIGSGSRD